jgi:predicted transcriptional regulator
MKLKKTEDIVEFEPKPEVLMNMACAFYENKSLNKTKLHSASGTTWYYYKKYLKWMLDNDCLEYSNAEKSYTPTPVGWKLFRITQTLYDHIRKKIDCMLIESNSELQNDFDLSIAYTD